MKRTSLVLACLFVFLLSTLRTAAQNPDKPVRDSLVKKFEYYRAKKWEGVLFAHFDKTVYTNNENVWFTAYLLNGENSAVNKVLSVELVKDDDRSIVLTKKFVIDRGIAFGNLFLTDSIASGRYSFILCTSEVYGGKPANVFVQPVTVKNLSDAEFNASLNLLDTGRVVGDGMRKVLLVTSAKGLTIVAGAAVTYFAGDKKHPVFSGKAVTDKAGQYTFRVPVSHIDESNNHFEVQVEFKNETRIASISLPADPALPVIRFYPEGGYLSAGLLNRVGWEAKDRAGNPRQLSGVIYEGGLPADTISTNSYGMGRFYLFAKPGARYYFKLLAAARKDTVYSLPGALNNWPEISISKAIVNDTLRFLLKSPKLEKLSVVVHNFRDEFFHFQTESAPHGKPVKVILDDVPKGLVEVTVLDSLGRPCCERLFFSHYDRRDKIKIATDADIYKKRQKVTVNISVAGNSGKPVSGLVSVACVQANRIEIKNAQDIESYFYLNDKLGRLPEKAYYMGTAAEDKNYLEDVLLIKGWRRYSWPELMKVSPMDTLKIPDSLQFTGIVTQRNKPPKKPVALLMFRDSSVLAFETGLGGKFNIDAGQLFTFGDKKIKLFANGAADGDVKLRVNDPYEKINQELAAGYSTLPTGRAESLSQNEAGDLSEFPRMIRLKEVKIKSDRDYNIFRAGYAQTENECGDYVCKFNILNCPNHRDDPSNRPPVVGEMYMYKGNPYYTYMGCQTPRLPAGKPYMEFDGIYYGAEFYPADYSKINPIAPEYVSTVYWNHLLKLSPGGKNTISFYTSDITGRFKIVVQGISQDDMVYGEKYFKVSKP